MNLKTYCFAIVTGKNATKKQVKNLITKNKVIETISGDDVENIDFVAYDIWKYSREDFDECSQAKMAVWLKGDVSTMQFYGCQRDLSCFNVFRLKGE